MCSDFPSGIVNVNRISRGIIAFPQAAEKTQLCGYFCSLGLSQSRDAEDPTGERVAHILICSQTLADPTQKNFWLDESPLQLTQLCKRECGTEQIMNRWVLRV